MDKSKKQKHDPIDSNQRDLPKPKKPMTQEERIQLAAKLDKELDEFIESLPRKKYEDGWPENRWEEEMEKHPFFMKEPPQPGQELHPLMEGLQALKYDPEENEPEDLATSYKEDGNFNFKHKNYRLAILAYTEGLKVKCKNTEVNANLYNNRSAAHYFLKNFRSALKDSEESLKLKPNYEKSLIRAANCCFELKRYLDCVYYCDEILAKDKFNSVILELRQKSETAVRIDKEYFSLKKIDEDEKRCKEARLIDEISRRGYLIEHRKHRRITLDLLEPCLPQLVQHRVYLDDCNDLVWPVVLVYPEYCVMDYIQEFNEKIHFVDQLKEVFAEPPEWDKNKTYRWNNVNIYAETLSRKLISVNIHYSIKDVLTHSDVAIKGGTPSFIIFVKDSAAEATFKSRH